MTDLDELDRLRAEATQGGWHKYQHRGGVAMNPLAVARAIAALNEQHATEIHAANARIATLIEIIKQIREGTLGPWDADVFNALTAARDGVEG